MNNVVMKFGGSSVADAEKIKKVAKILVKKKNNLKNVVCVVSAMGDTTDELIEKAKTISENPSTRELDMILSTGELISSSLLAMAVQELGEKAIALTGEQAGFKTYGRHGFSKILDVDTTLIEEKLKHGYIVIVAGFQGRNESGDITTLGRGGSDTSAVALAAKLSCDAEIYTDVEGIYSVDPRFYKDAKKLDHISYEETMEMAHLGAKVIDPRAVELAQKYGVRMYIALNTADVLGTIIDKEDLVEQSIIRSVSAVDGILLVTKKLVDQSIADLFSELANEEINIDVINETLIDGEKYVSFTSLVEEKNKIENISEDFSFIENVSKVSLIGNAMRNESGVAARIFNVLNANNVKFYQVSTSEISVSIIVDTQDKNKVMELFIREFNL
ncbi:aspartate kinase [Peptoniphilus sp. MSJ-1]|uniref:Aspartokinase n=1 Tax=Peptoniphilus ovalis TaxID=2841503 RepID=A0ABS6FIS2_9FIRM|nr:aspartate kinase [Peptoniphilus ovalis]MBU5670073.1 aspartate kinase [Peptoniphilus ovalis]